MTLGEAASEAVHRLEAGAADDGRATRELVAFDREVPVMVALFEELGAAIRSTFRRPRALVLPVAILAVGIALAATVFSVIQGVLLRGLPVEGSDRIVTISTGGGIDRQTPLSDVEALQRASEREGSAFETVAASLGSLFLLTAEDKPTIGHQGAYVSGNLFPMLGVEPLLGRAITPADVEPGAPQVSVLGYALWQSGFGGDPEIVGKKLLVNRQPTTVVGVMPAGFGFPVRQELWTALAPEDPTFPIRSAFAVARLARGRTLAEARSELELLVGRLDDSDPLPQPRGRWLAPFVEATVDPAARRALQILLVAAAGVLLVACASAASLRLAQAVARAQELEVRSALGAARGRLIAMLVTESAVAAVLAAAGGLTLAWALIEGAARQWLEGGRLHGFWIDVRIDAVVFGLTAALAGAAILISGLVPALLAVRRGGRSGLRSGSRVQSASSRAYVAVEIGLCFTLIVGAGVLTRNELALLGSAPGFDGNGLVTSWLSLFQHEQIDAERAVRLLEELLRRLEARPEVERAALGQGPPWGGGMKVEYTTGRLPEEPSAALPTVGILLLAPGYLETLGLPLLAGRSLHLGDVAGGEPAMVVSASFAERRLGGVAEAVGRTITLRQGPRVSSATVVGVVADVGLARWQPDAAADELAYVGSGLLQAGGSLLLRARGNEQEALRALSEEIATLDRLAAVYDPSSFVEDRATATWEQRRLSQLFLLFGAASLILVAGGLYSVVDLAGRRRARELGLRLALGAVPAQVRRLVLREGLVHLLGGAVIGAVALALLAPALRQFLVHVELWDPWLVIGSLALLALTVALAAAGPARRAGRLDPAETLRAE